jgi:hypothetical protein
MRHLLFWGDANHELGIPCGPLVRTFMDQRSQGIRLYDPDICTSPASKRPQAPTIPTPKARRKIRVPLGALAIVLSIILVSTLLLAGGNFLADSLITRLQAAEQRRIDQGWKEELAIQARYAPWIDAYPGQWYTIKWGQGEMRIRSKGTLRKLSELPKEGNQIGDFYNVEGQAHIFVWTTSGGASAPAWVDP